ncbi:hypothetical protein [Pseudomonas sp.]|uniref:hypothetical protein n=1 Tax=Pseudomonas sp. TaxID=306 RepID=UPI0028B0CC7F|nr:hypothetical protein [Pseudomonas sp.]
MLTPLDNTNAAVRTEANARSDGDPTLSARITTSPVLIGAVGVGGGIRHQGM